MGYLKTDKETLTSEDILQYISNHETTEVPHMNDLWEYYKGKNVTILKRKKPDPNNPDNKITISYGRKVINTFTGYGFRPKYITYKANIKKTDSEIEAETNNETIKEDPIEKKYVNELQIIFNQNNETIKTNRAGRNIAIFGKSYEILYIDGKLDVMDKQLPVKAIPRFFTVDPREMILLYNYDPEPKIKIGIRYYKRSDNNYSVEVYYKDSVELYIRKRDNENGIWKLEANGTPQKNYFNDVPINAFYLGDEQQSLIENILGLIDAYDVLFSDSMNEFDRFAFAYLIMKKFGLTNPIDKKDPNKVSWALKFLKQRRVFEHLDKDAEIKFLTKDIPTQFIQHIGKELHDQIHTQSQTPDFNQMTGALSGSAIDRLLFDFENLVSSVEADFDTGLYRRIELITGFLTKLKRINGTTDMVIINHKRNKPLNTIDYSNNALIMQNAGFSRRAIVGTMPEEIIPDVEKELQYEMEEQERMLTFNNSINEPLPEENNEEITEEIVEEEE